MTAPTPAAPGRRPVRTLPAIRRLLMLAVLLGAAVAGSALYATAHGEDPAPKAEADTTGARADTTAASHRVVAYYFHTNRRCASCRKIEAYTTEAIQQDFVEELKDGRLVYRVVNVEEKANEHFVKDYKLFTKSVILVDEQSGKQAAWKNLEKVWQLLNDKEAFLRYIRAETRAYLSGKQS